MFRELKGAKNKEEIMKELGKSMQKKMRDFKAKKQEEEEEEPDYGVRALDPATFERSPEDDKIKMLRKKCAL